MAGQKTPSALGTESIGKLLMQYAVPAIIAMTASSLYNMVDSIFIGHGVGTMAISGLALTFPLMNLPAFVLWRYVKLIRNFVPFDIVTCAMRAKYRICRIFKISVRIIAIFFKHNFCIMTFTVTVRSAYQLSNALGVAYDLRLISTHFRHRCASLYNGKFARYLRL